MTKCDSPVSFRQWGNSERETYDTKFKEFAMLVKNMRNKQKEYFKTRARDTLIESKKLEAMVDKRITEILEEEW